MNRYCIKIKFTNNTDIKIKHKIEKFLCILILLTVALKSLKYT